MTSEQYWKEKKKTKKIKGINCSKCKMFYKDAVALVFCGNCGNVRKLEDTLGKYKDKPKAPRRQQRRIMARLGMDSFS